MKSELPIRLVLVDPPAGIDFGIQRGKGSNFECVSIQRSDRGDLAFDGSLQTMVRRTSQDRLRRGRRVAGSSM
jgi:hypothetical protein